MCQQFKSSSRLQNVPSTSNAGVTAAKTTEVSATPRKMLKRQSVVGPSATRAKRARPGVCKFHHLFSQWPNSRHLLEQLIWKFWYFSVLAQSPTETTDDESSSSDDSGPEAENKGKKYICIAGIHDDLLQDERKLREPFQKLCQILGVPVPDKDIEKIYSNKRVTPHALIVMLKQSDLTKQIIRNSKKIHISANLNVLSGNKNANRITIGPYNIPGWTQKSYTAQPKAKVWFIHSRYVTSWVLQNGN